MALESVHFLLASHASDPLFIDFTLSKTTPQMVLDLGYKVSKNCIGPHKLKTNSTRPDFPDVCHNQHRRNGGILLVSDDAQEVRSETNSGMGEPGSFQRPKVGRSRTWISSSGQLPKKNATQILRSKSKV
jgi:hypothetical protein